MNTSSPTGEIPHDVLGALIVDRSMFDNADDEPEFLRRLKHEEELLFTELVVHVKKLVDETAVTLKIDFVLDDEVSGARQIIEALQRKYAAKLAQIE
jgi:hypothetical protein